jgi:hypothetical protein
MKGISMGKQMALLKVDCLVLMKAWGKVLKMGDPRVMMMGNYLAR